jgi:hypothetical protein
MNTPDNVGSLVEEYRGILEKTDSQDSLEGALIREGDWSPQAATHLLKLSKLYGSFMLRNALAISLVLEVEDGELAF